MPRAKVRGDMLDVLGRKQEAEPITGSLDRSAKATPPRVWEFDRESLALLRAVLERHGWPVDRRMPADAMLAAQLAGELDVRPLVAAFGADNLSRLGFIALPLIDGREVAPHFRCEERGGRLVVLPPGADVRDLPAPSAPGLAPAPRVKCLYVPFAGPQESFHAAPEFWLLFGGAKGGAKTGSFVADAGRYCERPMYKAWIFRRSLEGLREIIARTKALYGSTGSPEDGLGATYNESGKVFTFPSGATIKLHYLETVESTDVVQGQEPTRIYVDESAQNPFGKAIEKVSSEVRSPDRTMVRGMRESANPIGPGVPRLIDFYLETCGMKGERIHVEHVEVHGQKVARARRFIPSKITDNPVYRDDLEYLATLATLSPGMRRVLLDGDWSGAVGRYYHELSLVKHVVPAFPIPEWARLLCGFDWGFAHRWALVIGFFDLEKRLVVVDTLWGRQQQPDEVAARFRAWERRGATGDTAPAHRRLRMIHSSPQLFAKRAEAQAGSITRAEEFAREGYPLMKGDEGGGSRERKGQTLRRLLAWQATEAEPLLGIEAQPEREPLLVVMDTPGNMVLLRQLRLIVADETNPEEPMKVDYDHDAAETETLPDGRQVEVNYSGDDGQDGCWFLIDSERARAPKLPTAATGPDRRHFDTGFAAQMKRLERATAPHGRGF